MEHILDNPAYNALTSGNKNLANGTEHAKYFDREVSPFVAVREPSQANFQSLYDCIPYAGYFALVSPTEINIPAPWAVVRDIKVFQMIFEGNAPAITGKEELVPLNEQHVPAMLTLTKLTNPGPFAAKTIHFGNYKGIFKNDELVAMTGQRMHPFAYTEISAVCTHPNYLGNGYAKQLITDQINDIKAAAGIPILHVLTANERAIKVYQSLGFAIRRELIIYTIQKN
ncbi:GNAT family N-acetyltransferase [Mucilaginibacter sp.]|uniref:GNAT family N-acetyltransferase n=1 Tax=Mucilaginibacter sp. TaxID=1882438 RepID=UPI003D0FE4A5